MSASSLPGRAMARDSFDEPDTLSLLFERQAPVLVFVARLRLRLGHLRRCGASPSDDRGE